MYYQKCGDGEVQGGKGKTGNLSTSEEINEELKNVEGKGGSFPYRQMAQNPDGAASQLLLITIWY